MIFCLRKKKHILVCREIRRAITKIQQDKKNSRLVCLQVSLPVFGLLTFLWFNCFNGVLHNYTHTPASSVMWCHHGHQSQPRPPSSPEGELCTVMNIFTYRTWCLTLSDYIHLHLLRHRIFWGLYCTSLFISMIKMLFFFYDSQCW